MNRVHNKNSKGFTLVETLVAIGILSMAIAPALYTAYQSIIAVNFARDQMTASYLAQDAMDYLIAKKNQNIIACTDGNPNHTAACNYPDPAPKEFGNYWLADLALCDATGSSNINKKCEIDTTRKAIPVADPTDPTPPVPDPYVYSFPFACVDGKTPDCYLYFDPERSMYKPSEAIQSGSFATPTKFKRYVSFTRFQDDGSEGGSGNGNVGNEASVTVVVEWESKGIGSKRNVTLRSNIFNFKP
jgi:prepilin-type N-terminal cleavage/methylation domain-containing protein